jgi:hypothetical protein
VRRYAVYAVPGADASDAAEAVALYAAVQAWYGRAELQGLTVDARRYGFHATLVAPFRLAGQHSEAELLAAIAAFAGRTAPVVIPAIRPAAMGGFRALVPGGEAGPLNELAASVVREFDRFRAPLTEADVRRRRVDRLTARQRELLDRWGYPFVFDQFEFHLTLTDRVPAERAAAVDAALAQHFAPVTGQDVPLTGLTISVEPQPGAPFEILAVHPFAHSFALETA